MGKLVNIFAGSAVAASVIIGTVNTFNTSEFNVNIKSSENNLTFDDMNFDNNAIPFAQTDGRLTRTSIAFNRGEICRSTLQIGNIFFFPTYSTTESCRNLTQGDVEFLQETFPKEIQGRSVRVVPSEVLTLK